MFGFNYYTPTKVVFGKGTESRVAELVREFGGKKVLIHYGGGSVIRSGLLQRVTDTLDAAGIPYVTLGGAVPNPRLSLVYEGIELCKREQVDFLLASTTPAGKSRYPGPYGPGSFHSMPSGPVENLFPRRPERKR